MLKFIEILWYFLMKIYMVLDVNMPHGKILSHVPFHFQCLGSLWLQHWEILIFEILQIVLDKKHDVRFDYVQWNSVWFGLSFEWNFEQNFSNKVRNTNFKCYQINLIFFSLGICCQVQISPSFSYLYFLTLL